MSEDYHRAPLALATGNAHSVKLPPRVMRGRLTGFLFEAGRTFVLPSALGGIKGLASFYAVHPGLKVLVTGHTDSQGNTVYNRGLSEERAAAVAAYLTDDVAFWLARYQGGGFGSAWGVREDQHMLSVLPDGAPPYYAGKVHGQLDAATQAALRRFQTDHDLPVNGVPGAPTRRALITDYMAIDGTSLPAGTEVQQHGCGEHHHAVPTPDETDEPANRRVEVFFFEGPIAPPPRKPCPSPGCAEYPEWLRRTVLTFDKDLGDQLHSASVTVVDPAGDLVPGAAVVLQSAQEYRATAGADGVAHFDGLWSGRYGVVATHAGFEPGTGELLVAAAGRAPSEDAKLFAQPTGKEPAPPPKPSSTTVPLATSWLEIQYKRMFSTGNKEAVRFLDGAPVEPGITVTIDGIISANTDKQGVARFDVSRLGAGVHRAVASAASIDKRYDGVTGALVLPRPPPKDDILYRDLDILFELDAGLKVMSKPPPQLFSVATDGGTWRKGPRQILVDWKPVWMRAAKHAPRPGNPSPDAKDNPDVLVIHRTAGATLRSGENLFTGGNGTSVHYLIDVDGYVLKLVREDEVANHAGASFWRGTSGLNDVSVGIEIVSADFQDYPPAQIKALRDVMWSIRRAAKIPLRNVVGHSDIEVFGGGNLAPSHERPHDPGIEMDWVELATRRPNLGAIGDAVALDADMSTVTVAERMTMYGGYFVNFTEPWGNGDGDSKRQWGGKIRAPGTLMTSDPIAELQRDFKTIGYSIASNAAQTTDGVFDDRLGRLCQRFHHRWFGSPSRKASWGPFRDNLRFTFETAVMVKAVLKAL